MTQTAAEYMGRAGLRILGIPKVHTLLCLKNKPEEDFKRLLEIVMDIS